MQNCKIASSIIKYISETFPELLTTCKWMCIYSLIRNQPEFTNASRLDYSMIFFVFK